MRTRYLPFSAVLFLVACDLLSDLDNAPRSDDGLGGDPHSPFGGELSTKASGGGSADGATRPGMAGGSAAHPSGGFAGSPAGGETTIERGDGSGAQNAGGSAGVGGQRAGGGVSTGGAGIGASFATGGAPANSGGDAGTGGTPLQILDDFSSGATNARWLTLNNFFIQGGTLNIHGVSEDQILYGTPFKAPQWASFRLVEIAPSIDETEAIGLVLLANGTSCNLFTIEYIPNSGKLEIYRCYQASIENIAWEYALLRAGETLSARATPTARTDEFVIEVFIDGNPKLAVTATLPGTNSLGSIGLLAEFYKPEGTVRFDDFAGGEL